MDKDMGKQSIEDHYYVLVRTYLSEPTEVHLAAVADLGREMVSLAVPAEEVGEIHQNALTLLAKEFPEKTLPDFIDPLSVPLVELLMAYGMAFREKVAVLERSREALGQSEKKFKDFADASSDWLWETDENFVYTYVSDSPRDSTGISPDDLIGKKRWEISSQDVDPELWREHLAELNAHRPFREFICNFQDPDGREFFFRDAGKPVFNADGVFTGYRGSSSNITAQIEAENKAARTRARLRQSLESISEGFALFDGEGRLLVCNSRYREAYPLISDILLPGASFEEILRTTAIRGKITGTAEELEEWVQERLARALSPAGEECRLSDGRWYRISEQRTAENNVVKVLMDITDLRERQDALAEKSRLLETTFDNIDQGILLVSPELKFAGFNQRFLDLLDLPPDRFSVGTPLEDFYRFSAEHGEYGPGDPEEHVRVRMERIAKGGRRRNERLRPDGSMLEVYRKSMPDGGFVTTFTDITERKMSEQKLQQSQKMEAVGQLTGGIAHDFNNLLTVILGNLQLLERQVQETGDERLLKWASAAGGAAERGAALTKQLLAFSRRQALEPEVVDLNAAVTGMDSLLTRALGETINLKTVMESDLWMTNVDPHQLESAVLNLAVNARDAMPEGGKLTIETANVSLDKAYADQNDGVEPGDYVMVAVSDTGAGMSEEVMRQVFEPFFTTKETGKGTGLGLSMVYGFVNQSQGHIKIDSEEGHGTSIKLYFPRTEDTVEVSETGGEEEVPTGSETVLVVEDEEGVRDIAVTMLGDLGYQVLEAEDGPAALTVLKEHPDIDLLFTDVVMPKGMNGAELAIEAMKLEPALKVLYTSGYTDNALSYGEHLKEGVELLLKPYQQKVLAQKIRHVLDS